MNELRLNWLLISGNERIYIYGISPVLRRVISNLSRNEYLSVLQIAKCFGVPPRNLYYWLQGKRPVILNKFLEFVDASSYTLDDLFDDIKLNIKGVATGSGKRKKIILLPFTLTEDLAYLVGYLFGDGCLHSKKWIISFCDEYKEQIDRVNDLICKTFTISGKVICYPNKTELRVYSKALWLFFNKIFEMPSGKKYNIKIPSIIKNNLKLELMFFRGFMDADAGLLRIEEYTKIPGWAVTRPQIEIAQKNKIILEELRSVLERYSLKPSGPYFHRTNLSYRLLLNGKNQLIKCNGLNIFCHPIKKKRLETMCIILKSNQASVA